MHHDGRDGGRQLDAEIPVGDAVQAVLGGGVKSEQGARELPVDGIGRRRQRAAPEGGFVHPPGGIRQTAEVPQQHIGVGHQVVPEGDGLRPLQVGVAGHDGLGVLRRHVAEGFGEGFDLGGDFPHLVAEVQADVEGDLVVAAAGGVEALAGVAQAFGQLRLDEHVDVLRLHIKGKGAAVQVGEDPRQAGDDLFRLGGVDDAGLSQHGGVGDAAHDIVAVHPPVE